jgi:hypothetical protein
MRKTAVVLGILCFVSVLFAGFKVKNIKPKKAEQFQCRATINGVTYAADLLIDGKAQKDYFYKELTSSNRIAVRLAVINNGREDVILPVGAIELQIPNGKSSHPESAESVAQAVLDGIAVSVSSVSRIPRVAAGGGAIDPRSDPSNPGYDPRLDPNSPRYDPTDPRNTGQYPPGSYPGATRGTPGVVLYPGGGGGEDLSQYERQLAEKDFCDKAHTSEPVLRSAVRDRFLYFPVERPPASTKGCVLRIPASPGIPQEVLLRF